MHIISAPREFQKWTNLSQGTQASQRSIESRWGWVARRGSSSRQGRSQTSCQVGPLAWQNISLWWSDSSRRSETGWLGALLLLCDNRSHRARALSWSSLQTSWNCCFGMAIIFCSWIKILFQFWNVFHLTSRQALLFWSWSLLSTFGQASKIVLQWSERQFTFPFCCPIGEERLCWRDSWRQKTRGSSWWARFLPASRWIFELGNIIAHFFFN